MSNKKNIEFITELMEFSHPMMQPFILEAVEIYSQQIQQMDRKDWKFDLIDFDAWQHCANEYRKKYRKKYADKFKDNK